MPLLVLSNQSSLTLGPPAPNSTPLGVEAVTLDQIVSADWSLMLDRTAAQIGLASGIGAVVQGVEDVNQCITIILTTPKGSDPLRPTFGCDLWQYLDVPITLAVPHIVREVTEALTIWEPRIRVIAVTAALAPKPAASQLGASLQISVTWQLKLGVRIRAAWLQQNKVVVTVAPALGN